MQIIKNSFHFCLLSSPVISCSLLDRQYSAPLYQEMQTSHCVSHDLTKSLSLTRIIFPVFYFFTPLSSWIKSNKCVKQLRKSLNRRPVKWHSQFFLTVLFSFRNIKNLLKKKTKKPKIKNWSHYSWTRWTKACCTVKRRGRTVQTQLGECLTNLFVHLHRTLRWPVSQSGYKPLLSDRGAQTKHNTHL